MRRTLVCVAVIVLVASAVWSKSLEDFINEAQQAAADDDANRAVEIMEEALKAYPDSATAYAYMGLYKGMLAGKTDNFLEAGVLSSESFGFLDKAVELDPNNLRARLYRGLIGVKVPEFLGRLDQAISDLEFVTKVYETSPSETNKPLAMQAYELLAEGYEKQGKHELASQASRKYSELAEKARGGEQPAGEAARAPLDTLSVEDLERRLKDDPNNVAVMTALGKAYIDAGNFASAEEILRQATAIDSTYAPAYKYLGTCLSLSMRGQVYDERIHEDTNWAARRAFEIMRILDKAVELAPDDLEARFLRGVMGINMPFFVRRLEQGISDLETVYQSDAPAELKAEAGYYLGIGYERKGMSYWHKVLSKYGDLPVARMVLEAMRPPIEKADLSSQSRPLVAIDFVIAFKDQIAPQVAVWVETEDGDYVRTVYVSGFSGHVKEVQVVLPVWARTSKFIDADAVTAASIDVGEHVYIWDLTDSNGEKVKPGKYIIKVEATFWPSNKYQLIEAPIEIGSSEDHVVVREGDFVPYLEVTYLPQE